MILDSTVRKIQVVLAAPAATLPCPVVACYVDRSPTTSLPGCSTASTNGTTAVDVVPAPAPGQQRKVTRFSVSNTDTAPVTVSVRYNDNGTSMALITVALGLNETLHYGDSRGFFATDASGNIKTSGPASLGRLLARTLLTAGTSFTTGSSTTRMKVTLLGGGGEVAGPTRRR